MTTIRSPRWIRIISATIGCAALVLSGICFFAPHLLFGLDVYRTLTRLSLGLLGALAAGLGITAVVAAAEGDPVVLRTVVLAMFIASALTPPVIIYNIGAFDQMDTSGVQAFSVAGVVILGVSLPLLLSLLVLQRLRQAAKVEAAPAGRQVARTVQSDISDNPSSSISS